MKLVVSDYRSYVGARENYDLISAEQFNLLTTLGMREHHFLLDIGCGSLRAGRLFIPYLLPEHYFGIEPNQWLIEEGLRSEIGECILQIKKPTFSNDSNFTLSCFRRDFDFIIANSIFTHAAKDSVQRCLSEAKKVMKKESIFAATVRLGDKDYEGKEWAYPRAIDYTEKTISKMILNAGLSFVKMGWRHQARKQTWLGIVEPGNEKAVEGFYDYLRMKNRLQKIESNPLFKLGIKVRKLRSS